MYRAEEKDYIATAAQCIICYGYEWTETNG